MNISHKITTFRFIIIPLLFFSCQNNKESAYQQVNNFKDLKDQFAVPPAKFSTAPLWVWNDSVTREKIDQQLEDFKDKGIYQVFIHPRPGMITEYLSDDWFRLVKYCVEKGKETGMLIWLYDENSFPSGFAGGHVLARMPQGFDPYIGLKLHRADELAPADSNKYELVLKKSGQSFTDITYSLNKNTGRKGEFYAFSKWYYPTKQGTFAGGSYVDLLAYGITQKFINTTMTGYEKYVGSEFGKTIPGIFTDEPNINPEGGPVVIRTTPSLFSRFEEKYGYRLETYLPCLYEETGDWRNIRHDYYALLLEMFISRWSKPWNSYADSTHLIWTGHYWEHAWPNPQYGGDNMAMYEWHQYPGIDLLFNAETRRPDQFGNIRNVKELASVANQLGKERSLSETYGASGWELRFEDMKRNGDWEYALGINFMTQHLSYMTIKGARKRDFPQSMSYHTPWWNNYKPLNDYYKRLSFALSSGAQINRIMVMEPTTTAWMYYSPDQEGDFNNTSGKTRQISESFYSLLSELEKAQVEYDLGCENIIRNHGKVENDRIIVGQRSYDLILFPENFENLEQGVFDLILEYLKNGGKVISLAGYPSFIDGNFSLQAKNNLISFGKNWQNIAGINDLPPGELSINDSFIPVIPRKWNGNVFHQRREFKDGNLYFFINYDTIEISSIHFLAKGVEIAELDPLSGKINKIKGKNMEDKLEVDFQLYPANSKLLFISDHQLDLNSTIESFDSVKSTINTSELSIRLNQANTITLDYCDLSVAGKTYKDIYFYNAADTVFKTYLKEKYGFNYNPWSVATQYKTQILDKNHFDSNSGFKVNFPFNISKGFNSENILAVIEDPKLYTMKINDISISSMEGKWWLDRSFGVFDIGKYIKPGRNEISYSIKPMDILAEIEPIYLIGDFTLANSEQGWILYNFRKLDLGSWKSQGMPFYSNSVIYEKTFNADTSKNYEVELGKWYGTVAEVQVNGKKAGIIAWKPYKSDISKFTKQGTNTVQVIITGSLKNQLGPHHNNPILGLVTPWSFFFAPAHQPPSSEYQLLDYGLFEDFKIKSN